MISELKLIRYYIHLNDFEMKEFFIFFALAQNDENIELMIIISVWIGFYKMQYKYLLII